MYIFYSGPNDCYASAGVSKRKGSNTSVEVTYLGRVLDKEAGIYKNRERGIYTFDPVTEEYGSVPEDYVPAEITDHRKRLSHVSVDFGDAFFMDSYLHASGMMKVVNTIKYGNPDTLHAMLLFYMLSGLANCDVIHWYEGNIASLLYPKANLTSQRLSSFLASIGTPENQMAFQKAYIEFVLKHYNGDKNILIDSSGLPNDIHFSLTETNVHNGKVSNEIRLIFVVQKTTGLPLYYRAVPGNIVDVSTLSRIFLHLDSMGIDVSSCIMDAGYNSGDNLDLFYDENHQCKIGFITRIGSCDKNFKELVRKELSGIECKENFIKYEDRYLFIIKRPVMVGNNKDNPAWMYLGLDCSRMSDEQHKLLKRARRDSLTTDEVYEAMQNEGVFGILSGKDYSCEEILPAYYQRQAAEQIFDFAKNYTKLLPLRTSTIETFNGHLLLSYIATCVVKMIQLRLKEANLFFGSRLACLRNQKCTIYDNRIVTDEPQREANETYKTFGMKCPEAIPFKEGSLQYIPPDSDSIPKERKKRREKAEKKNEENQVKKKGRPKGSRNKKTLEREKALEAQNTAVRRGRGRPKGSKNKATLERETLNAAAEVKRRRGRPKGSKNKKTLEKESTVLQQTP